MQLIILFNKSLNFIGKRCALMKKLYSEIEKTIQDDYKNFCVVWRRVLIFHLQQNVMFLHNYLQKYAC